MQQLTAFASLALATYGLTLGGAIADHGSPAETEQAILTEFGSYDPHWKAKFDAFSRFYAHCKND